MPVTTAAPMAVDTANADVASVNARAEKDVAPGSPKMRRRGRPFVERPSQLDSYVISSENDAALQKFRGFFVLFWTSVAMYAVSIVVRNFAKGKEMLGASILHLLWSHLFEFAVIDGAMMISLYGTLLLNKLLVALQLRHSGGVGELLQHAWQTLFFGLWLKASWGASWSWIQSGIFTLHVTAMLFKMHSFSMTNGEYRDRWIVKKTAASGAFRNKLDLKSFTEYLLFPTLVYELEYPRSPSIRWSYVAGKVMSTFAGCFMIYLTLEHSVMPLLNELHKHSFFFAVHELLFPIMICYLMLFFLIFECVLNGFAELTRFADRNFYDDWWNSSTFDQFARKWNKPVHEFLLRHVYLESIETYKVSKTSASAITFLFSSCLHEVVMIMVSRKIKFYLFFLQMLQLPLIYLGSLPSVKCYPICGNAFFWFSMYCGPPLLAVAYCWEFYTEPK